MLASVAQIPSFRGIEYNPDKSQFNKSQLKTAKRIVSQFKRIDKSDKKRRSYENLFERYGYEFLIEPDDENFGPSSVKLYAHTGSKIFNKIKDMKQKYPEKIYLASYNLKSKFDVEEIKFILKEEQSGLVELLSSLIIPIAVLIAIFAKIKFKM